MPALCFVTGATGFVGGHLVPRLAREFRLRLLVRDGRALPQFAEFTPEVVPGTIADEGALRDGMRGADVAVHLAAMVSFRREDRDAMFAVNTLGTQAVAAAARAAGVRRLLHVSTISAIGCSLRPELLDEDTPYNFAPLRIGYCDSKFAAERHVLAEVRRGLDAVIVNPPSMYGAGDRRKGGESLLGVVFAGGVRVAPPGGLNVANVADVCDGIVRALHKGRTGERYILGGENLTGAELLQRIAGVIGGRAPRRALPRRVVNAGARVLAVKERWFGTKASVTSEILRLAGRYLWYSSAKAESELDWRAGRVDDGIADAWRELRAGR